ncbi:hypothetical protein [Mycoplasmopsis columboralis]|uniref:Nucleotidyltransferase n=1 Tax=Mycoplasmopsis columboralis TaxID=171282 RepID=A0A449B7G5_9BACT|nr:hypothetical protein [Mycoplasmopsis columboralis]VEU76520.1 Uncharacterised protein [Mycoplasmopsis columboralis]
MYKFVTDKKSIKEIKTFSLNLINKLVVSINKEKKISVQWRLVGSGARNLITENGKKEIDFDFNLIINKIKEPQYEDLKKLKDYVRMHLNKKLSDFGYRDSEDSTSSLTTHLIKIKKSSREFKIDIAIVKVEKNSDWYRLIHKKTGDTDKDEWKWEKGPNSNELIKRAQILKKNGWWLETRQAYLTKKNLYLSRGDKNHSSYICFSEAVNEIYNKYSK